MVEKDAVRRAYDEMADVHAEQRTDDEQGMAVLDRFLDSLGPPARVLDAGCGQGSPVLTRLSDDYATVGLDFSREQLRLAAGAVPAAALTQGDMTALPFTEDAFDAVVAYWSLIHVPLADHQTVVDEFARVLAPGGRLLLCEGSNEWVGENPDWLDSGVRMAWEIAGPEATRAQLRRAGFTVDAERNTVSSLEADRESEREDESPWTFFEARLEE